MPEETQSSDQKPLPPDPDVLRQQADELRQTGYLVQPGAPSRITQIIYLVVLVLVIGSVVYLLASRDARMRLLRGAGSAWARVSSSERAEVYKLPPPPPKEVEPKVELRGVPTIVFRGGNDSPAPAPTDMQAGEEQGDAAAPADETKPPAPPEKTAGSQGAYDLLLKNSAVARKLSANGFSDLRFKEWRPVRNDPPDFMVNLVAVRGTQEVNFIWSVNTETQSVRPLSQDARDLERR